MTDKIELSQGEKEAGALVKILIAGYAIEQIQGVPLKAAQVDELFGEHVSPALKWRMETLEDRTGPLTLMDFAIYTLFQILGGYVAANVVLTEVSDVTPGMDAVKMALRMSGRAYAEKAAARMELVLD